MRLLSKILNTAKDAAKWRRLGLRDGAAWASSWGYDSTSGKPVSLNTALQLSAVWACVKLTAQAVSSLPLAIYKTEDGRISKPVDDRLAEILTDSPNADQTALEYWESIVAWLLCEGNAYSERVMIGPNLSALQPISSHQCRPVRRPDGELVFRINDRGKTEYLPRDKIFHIKGFGQGFGDNFDMGMSAIRYGVNNFGASIAADEASAKTFANGMRPTGFFLLDHVLTAKQREDAQKMLVEPLKGSANAGRVGILEGGAKWQSISLNPEDSQLLQTRGHNVEEICRWFGVPPVIVGHAAKGQTMWGSGVEQILISWLTLGIDPICDRIEARIKKQFLRPMGHRHRQAMFDREALLQMDSKAKAAFLSSMVQNGLMNRNEGRAKLNLASVSGGDVLTAQTNLAPIENLGAASESNAAMNAIRNWLGLSNEEKTDEQA